MLAVGFLFRRSLLLTFAMILSYITTIELEDLGTGRSTQTLDVVELGNLEGAFCLHQQQITLHGIEGKCEAGLLTQRFTLFRVQYEVALFIDDAVNRCKAVFQWQSANKHGQAGCIQGASVYL